jgi:hypothetical protein
MIAERMHRLGVEAGALARSVHGSLWNGPAPRVADVFWHPPPRHEARCTRANPALAKRVIRAPGPAR